MWLIIIFSLITLQSHVTSEPINHLDQLDQKWVPFAQHQEDKRSVPIDEETFSVVRTKRELSVVHIFFRVILFPVQILIDGAFNGIIRGWNLLYVSSQPSNIAYATVVNFTNPIVLDIIETVTNFQAFVDGIFYFFYGISTSSSRRKRELFDLYNIR